MKNKKLLGIIILGMIILANLYSNKITKKLKIDSFLVSKIFNYQLNSDTSIKTQDLSDVSYNNVEFMIKKK